MSTTENCGGCRIAIVAALVSLTLMCGALGMFFLQQATILKRQVQHDEALIKDYKVNGSDKAAWFVNSLQTFARSYPDFNPILAKYSLLPPAGQLPPAAPKK